MKTKLKNSIYALLCLMLCTVLLLGCSSMRTEYKDPELAIPGTWSPDDTVGSLSQAQKAAKVEQPDKWWTLFDDSQLNSLIDQVLKSNSDLAQATLTLRRARLVAGLTESSKVPSLSFSHDSSFEYDLDAKDTDSDYSSSLSLNYEVDLWGRVDAAADADTWAAIASYEDRESTAQSLVVTTATLYWKIAYLNQMIKLTEQNVTGTERIVMLTKQKHDNGSATLLEVLESTQSLFNQQVDLSQLQQELSETNNAISMLLNQPLQSAGIMIDQLSEQPMPAVEAGIPSSLLLRRPDIKAALYMLKSSLAAKDATDASYMPTFTLTSALSTSSSSLLSFLQNPIATLGSGITLPFLQWNEMKLNKAISELDYQSAVIDYKDTIYTAFEEVANLLVTKDHYHYQGNVYKEQYSNAKKIEAIYESKYQNGASDMVDWINAMESRRSIESSLLENRYNQFVTQVKFYQSLGGGDIVPEG